MIRGGQIDKGMCLIFKGVPHLVVEREFVNPGKGSAFCRVKMKNLMDQSTLTQTIKSEDQVEDSNVALLRAQYQYKDDDSYHFMDLQSYDQIVVPRQGLEDKALFLLENEEYDVVMWEVKPIDIKIPFKMVFKITKSDEHIKGDSVTGARKPATLETGLVIKVPLFVKEGERVLINTETKEYVERAN